MLEFVDLSKKQIILLNEITKNCIMHDIWNPWHGCIKKSEGCKNCYVYYLDKKREKDGSHIFRVKSNFDYPIQKDKYGNYKIKSGEFLRVCMTSDFFLEEADEWREEVWNIIGIRKDVVFMLITKRPERVMSCSPKQSFDNVWFHTTCENQKRVDERLPITLDLPFKHKGIFVSPFIGEVSLEKYLKTGEIENVWCGGENYGGCRPLYYEWVEKLSNECRDNDVSFKFYETGNNFVKNGKRIFTSGNKIKQMELAFKYNLNYESSKKQIFNVPKYVNVENNLFGDSAIIHYKRHCEFCPQKQYCIGCSDCGKCGE